MDVNEGQENKVGRRWPFWVRLVLFFAGSVALIPTLGTELVPELIQGEFFVDAELPPGTHLDVTARRLANLGTEDLDRIARYHRTWLALGTKR